MGLNQTIPQQNPADNSIIRSTNRVFQKEIFVTLIPLIIKEPRFLISKRGLFIHFGAEGENRTPTGNPRLDPEPSASTNSATSAIKIIDFANQVNYLYIFHVPVKPIIPVLLQKGSTVNADF